MVNYKNSNEHYVANYILYGEPAGSEEDLQIYLYHDYDLEYAVTAKEFKEMFYGAPVHIQLSSPDVDGGYYDVVVSLFAEGDGEVTAFITIMGQEARIVFPE